MYGCIIMRMRVKSRLQLECGESDTCSRCPSKYNILENCTVPLLFKESISEFDTNRFSHSSDTAL